MKTLTFFNEKGGTGKTTLTTLMASWLAYKKGCPVVVYDCDYPSYHLAQMRADDLALVVKDPSSAFVQMAGRTKPYPVTKALSKSTFSPAELSLLAQRVREARGEGYFLLDFPGRFLPNDPVAYLSKAGLLDLVVFPVDTDRQSRASAMAVYVKMMKANGTQRVAALWNRETAAERRGRRDWYGAATAQMEDFGIHVIGTRMRDVLIARRDASTFGFIRNTLCWPQRNIDKACPYIEDIFEEIKERLDNGT